MSRKRPGPKSRISGVHLSISCKDTEWSRSRRLADAAGKTISRYLIDCAMEAAALMEKGMDAPSPDAEGLVLDAAQQQALLDGVRDLAARLPGDRQIAEQAAMAIRLRLLTAGCRKSEILNLPWDHVDLKAGEMCLSDSKTGLFSFPGPVRAIRDGISFT